MYYLNIVSIIGTYMFLISLLFFLLRYTIFNFKKLKNKTVFCFYVNDLLSLTISTILSFTLFTVH